MTDEMWRPIKGHKGYEVSNHGRVRSYFTRKINTRGTGKLWSIGDQPRRILAGVHRPDGRYSVLLRSDGKSRFVQVAILVLDEFVGPKPHDGLVINHKDGNTRNNHLDNLEYTTRSVSIITKKAQGYGKTGMCEADVVAMRQEYADGAYIGDLAKKYNMTKSGAYTACRGITYKYFGGPTGIRAPRFSDEDIREMRRLRWEKGWTLPQVAEKFKLDQSYVSRVVRGLDRKDAGGLMELPDSRRGMMGWYREMKAAVWG